MTVHIPLFTYHHNVGHEDCCISRVHDWQHKEFCLGRCIKYRANIDTLRHTIKK